MSSECDLCGAASDTTMRVAAGQEELLGTATPVSTVACRRCRFIFQPERFSDALLAALYEHDTSFDFGGSDEESPVVRSCLAERQGVVSAALSAHAMAAGAAVLDVGGGRGECCRHLLPRYRVVVADTTPSAPVDSRIERLQGLHLENVERGTFDVVVMNHILEHVFSPSALLSSAHGVLRKDGILIAEVPFELYTPLVARHLGDWRHVGYFCRTTLRQFLEKCGFAVERLALEDGCYGARRLPVIRAVASKKSRPKAVASGGNSPLVLLRDMLAPVVLGALARRLLHR
jgi:SAM-dependent methyltransferase